MILFHKFFPKRGGISKFLRLSGRLKLGEFQSTGEIHFIRRGPVGLEDGRRRLILRSATDLDSTKRHIRLVPFVSARSLLPLARHIQSCLTGLNLEASHESRPSSRKDSPKLKSRTPLSTACLILASSKDVEVDSTGRCKAASVELCKISEIQSADDEGPTDFFKEPISLLTFREVVPRSPCA